jgi:hypothetical protein
MYTILLELIPITAAAGGGASPYQPHPPQPAGIATNNILGFLNLAVYIIGFLLIIAGKAILSKLSNNQH